MDPHGFFEVVGERAVARQKVRVVWRQPVFLGEALAAQARKLGQLPLDRGDPGRVGLDRDQIGIGEVPVVVRVLLRAHGHRDRPVRIPEARLLDDPLAAVERASLARRLVLEGVSHVAEGVHVLDLDLRAELGRTGAPDRDVGVAAKRARLHVPIADAEVPEDRPKAPQVFGGLGRGPEIRPGHDLHERHPGAVEVDLAGARRLEHSALVGELADVLLQVEALDPDPAGDAVGLDLEPPVLGQRRLVLADLVVLRHVGVEVVLPRETALGVDPAAERERGADAELDGPTVDDREDPGHPLTHRAGLMIRRRAERRRAAAEHLGARQQLRVHLEADDGLPGPGHRAGAPGIGAISGRRAGAPRAAS